MNNLVIYVHGKGGNYKEAEHYIPLFPNDDVIGFEYKATNPWDSQIEFRQYFDNISKGYKDIYLIANSIGAYFSLASLNNSKISKAYLISPIVNMEKLIKDMMMWAGINEEELKTKKNIQTSFGETLSWDYYCWVKTNPVTWNKPTYILYGELDNLQSIETIDEFAKRTNSTVTIMEKGEHWFHTKEQMEFLDNWIKDRK